MNIWNAGLTRATTRAADKLETTAAKRGIGMIITSGRRSRAKQQALWDARASNRYPVARPGYSDHEKGIAFDAVANPRNRQYDLGNIWRHMGGQWSPKDEIHFVWRKTYTTA